MPIRKINMLLELTFYVDAWWTNVFHHIQWVVVELHSFLMSKLWMRLILSESNKNLFVAMTSDAIPKSFKCKEKLQTWIPLEIKSRFRQQNYLNVEIKFTPPLYSIPIIKSVIKSINDSFTKDFNRIYKVKLNFLEIGCQKPSNKKPHKSLQLGKMLVKITNISLMLRWNKETRELWSSFTPSLVTDGGNWYIFKNKWLPHLYLCQDSCLPPPHYYYYQ